LKLGDMLLYLPQNAQRLALSHRGNRIADQKRKSTALHIQVPVAVVVNIER
jgi:hypothetical protein